MSVYQSIIMSIFDLVCFLLISRKLLQGKLIPHHVIIVTIIFAAINGTMATYFNETWYSPVLSAVTLFGVTYLFYRRSLFETIYAYLISTVLIIAIQILTMLPLYIIFGKISVDFKMGLIAQIVNVTLTFFFTKWVPLQYLYHFVLIKNKAFEYIITNAFVTAFLLIIYWNINIEGILENLVSITALSLIIIFINLTILRDSFRNEQTLNKLKANEQYMPIIDELISDIKTRQHDFNNHLQALNMMIYASKDKEELIQQFEGYTGQISNKKELNEILKFKNKVIAGFLYGKKAQAEAQNIKFNILINEVEFESKLFDYEWIELLGILIDNALETHVEDNQITVIIDKEQDMNMLLVKNKHPYLEKDFIKNMFNKGFSSKSNANRGLGLYNVKQIVSKYKGNIETYNETGPDNYVVMRVLIP